MARYYVLGFLVSLVHVGLSVLLWEEPSATYIGLVLIVSNFIALLVGFHSNMGRERLLYAGKSSNGLQPLHPMKQVTRLPRLGRMCEGYLLGMLLTYLTFMGVIITR